MPRKLTIQVPVNRIEGDLEIRLEIHDNFVADAWSSGIMYRGFENLLVGRGPLDGLVITPRICGICSTAHLMAASQALEMISGVNVPPGAAALRNLAMMVEKIQSDMRHAFLMFAVDFANPVYGHLALYNDAVKRYASFRGETAAETIKETKKILEIIAIIGGQWPHSSYMVPGGVTAFPSSGDLFQCRYLLSHFRSWYERRILGCPIERWLEVQNASEIDSWLDESESHRTGELGFLISYGRKIGLDTMGGRGHGNFISFGVRSLSEGLHVAGERGCCRESPAGFARGIQVDGFDQRKISEHIAHSWFRDYEGGRHPFDGETQPHATGQEGIKYSWAKAPRYDDLPAETGPLSEMIIGGSPLFRDLVSRDGANVLSRELARLVRPAELILEMQEWLSSTSSDAAFYEPSDVTLDGRGFGLIEAARGALGHWVTLSDGKIARYQIITPTAWNASPRDGSGTRGPWEEALIGTEIKDLSNPVEVGHVIRSFDACLVCAVHAVSGRR